MDERPVVVGVDGSPNSRLALQWAAEYGRRYGVPVQGLITWERSAAYGAHMVSADEERAGFEQRARELLEEAIRGAVGAESIVERIEEGHPAASLVEASKSAQLLVVGTRGRGAFAGMLLGSVSQQCVVHALCPVVVVPDESTDER